MTTNSAATMGRSGACRQAFTEDLTSSTNRSEVTWISLIDSSLVDQKAHEGVICVSRREVAVDLLDHPQRAVAQDLRQLDRVHTARQRPGCERVAQEVRIHALLDAGLLAEGPERQLEACD